MLESVSAAVSAAGGESTVAPCDVEDNESVRGAFDVARGLGTVEVVIFNVAPPFPEGKDFASLPQPEDAGHVVAVGRTN